MGSFSLWHWLIVGVPLAIVVYFVFSSRRKAVVATADGGSGTSTAEPKGLGGWLVLLGLGQVFGVIRILKEMTDSVGVLEQAVPHVKNAVVVDLSLNGLFLALVVYVSVTFFREKRTFPTLWKIQAAAAILLPLIDIALIASMLNLSVSQLVDEKMIGQLIGSVIVVSIWVWYLSVSRRVRNTFVK